MSHDKQQLSEALLHVRAGSPAPQFSVSTPLFSLPATRDMVLRLKGHSMCSNLLECFILQNQLLLGQLGAALQENSVRSLCLQLWQPGSRGVLHRCTLKTQHTVYVQGILCVCLVV